MKKAEKALLRLTSNQFEKRGSKELPTITFCDYFLFFCFSFLPLAFSNILNTSKILNRRKTFDHIIQYSKHRLIIRFKYLADHTK